MVVFAGTWCRYIDDGFSLLNRLQVAKGTTCLHLSAQLKLRPSLLQLECHAFEQSKISNKKKLKAFPFHLAIYIIYHVSHDNGCVLYIILPLKKGIHFLYDHFSEPRYLGFDLFLCRLKKTT